MADSTVTTEVAHDVHDEDHAHHPTERQYWVVFVALAALTAIEVAWSYLGLDNRAALVLPLLAMMAVKFLLVAGAFMHLYFDLKIINGRLFSWAFGFSLLLAVVVYFVVFAAFDKLPF
ncbi:MAG: cytochrome C oxidase subunit IV family protein [Acidimicrobiia bacterium]|nr:cytochrome C oxidase subunit IV family protein [Acidimicrobiia bacterium]